LGGIAVATVVAEAETYTQTDRLTYQAALRAIGQWLDLQEATAGMRIVETPDGFLVAHTPDDDPDNDVSWMFTFDDMIALAEDMSRRTRFPGGSVQYQDLLRAVGYELDEVEAHAVLLEQVNDDLLLTYLYPNYVGGLSLHKQFTVMPQDAAAELVCNARERRTAGSVAKGFLTLLGIA
jgi:hypothetical protein